LVEQQTFFQPTLEHEGRAAALRWAGRNCKDGLNVDPPSSNQERVGERSVLRAQAVVSIAFPRTLFGDRNSTFSSTIVLSGFDEGVANYRAGNYKDAFKEWTEAAQQGDADAQYNLGCLYVAAKPCRRTELGDRVASTSRRSG